MLFPQTINNNLSINIELHLVLGQCQIVMIPQFEKMLKLQYQTFPKYY